MIAMLCPVVTPASGISAAQNDGPIGKGDYIAHVVDDQDHRSARGTAKIRLHCPDP
jgi:hypothetical protein